MPMAMPEVSLPLRTLVIAFLVSGLNGCLGVGSAPALRLLIDPDSAPPETAVNPDRVTVSGGTSVTVAVVDSGARLTHNEFADGVVTSTYNAIDGSSNVTDADAVYHGTAMASIVAGKTQGYSGNANLMIVKAFANNGGDPSVQANAVAYAAQHGARVINTSTTGYQTTHPDAIFPYQSIVTHGSVWVTSAGNGGQNITDVRMPSAFFFESRPDLADIRDRMLVVGRLNAAGTDRDADSDYPGSNTLLQQRFLMAPGTDIGAAHGTGDSAYREVDGTSPAAAVVSATAASIISKWPHLTAPETASILLDTAKRNHSLYSQNTCGATGNLNCGGFYMGRGIMDPNAALNPVGTLAMALSDDVDGPAAALTRTGLMASTAFGDAFNGMSQLPVAAFDDYGRDYLVTLRMVPAMSAIHRFGGLGAFMQRGQTEHLRMSDGFATQEGWMRFNADGTPVSAALSFQQGDTRVTGYRFGYGESNPAAMPEGFSTLRMLSYNGNNAVANDYVSVSGVSGELASGVDGVRIGFDAWRANNTVSGLDGGDQSATRTEIALRFAPTDWMRLSAGVASLTERDAMLGTKASGALAFQDGTPFLSQTLSLDVTPFDGASLFARYEQGRMGNLQGTALIERVTDIRASQFAAGATYGSDDIQIAMVASAPLRVDSATAHLNVPTGRTIDGKVISTHYATNLAPSGCERNVEIALATRAGETGVVQVNLGRRLEPGHNANAKPENMIAVSYGMKF